MEPVRGNPWLFDVSPDTAVVTTTYVTRERKPILYVTHDYDAEEGIIWQFHCGNGDYGPNAMQLVRLDEILEIDSGIKELAGLPLGHCATRSSFTDNWIVQKDPPAESS